MWLFLMTMLLDGDAAPAGLVSVKAHVNNSLLMISGVFEVGSTVPILLWPSVPGQIWVNTCRGAISACCLGDMPYRNDALAAASACSLAGNLVSGSRPGVVSGVGHFSAAVPMDTAFVAMLFVHQDPFYVIDGYQAITMMGDGMVDVRLSVQSSPCYSVQVPGKSLYVCMVCGNMLPLNAHFVWTPTWFVRHQCDWECDMGYIKGTAVCTSVGSAVPLILIPYVLCAVVVLGLCVAIWMQRRPIAAVPDTPGLVSEQRCDVIMFKEATITAQHLRVKVS